MTGASGSAAAAVEAALAREAGAAVAECRVVGGDHGVRHYRARLADGRELFVKAAPGVLGGHGDAPPAAAPAPSEAGPAGAGPAGAGLAEAGLAEAGLAAAGPAAAGLAAEAAGLRWLAEAGAVPIPEVVACADGLLALSLIPPGNPDRAAAEQFGHDLARLHQAGPGRFGAPWPGFIASLPLRNDQSGSWPAWYAEHRLLPYCRLALDQGALGPADVALVESVASRIGELAGPAEPAARIHGDCWSGNVLWSGGRGWLIDPAAHGGHRETDLAMLALFGAPHLDRITSAYAEATPLAVGWRSRVPLHQLHPLLVHVCLFGSSYRQSLLAAAQSALSA